jgi:hypothetical protein
VLLSLAASHGLLIHQMDVKTSFLNGDLDEEIYMEQPAGFVANGQEGMVCKLLKSLYGLKQAPKQWHEKFDRTLTSVGFVVNEVDKCVYYRYGGGRGVILCIYVDDILILGMSLDVIKETKDFLSNNFEMKDLGEDDVILNIKLPREGNGGVTLVQSHYVEKVLSHFGYVFSLGGGAVSWKSCKQTILTRSTMEAELTALDTASVEAEWLRKLLMDLPVVEKPVPTISMNCDNHTVIIKINSSKDNMKSTRHIKRRLKSFRKLRNSGALDYVHTSKNLADQLTKGLSRSMIDSASSEMGLRPT